MLAGILLAASLHAAEPPQARQPWTTSRIVGSPEPPKPFRVVRAFPQIKFDHPVALVSAPGTDRLFVVEQGGKLFSFPQEPSAAKADLLIDLRQGLKSLALNPNAKDVGDVYGLAFHPQFAQNRYCYICYVLNSKNGQPLPDGTRVSRFTVTATDPPRCDPDSEQVIITFLGGGHNGGCLAFGPDGKLYISTGDAASPNPPDPLSTGQNLDDLLSCVLRIDVDRPDPGRPYGIPTDNPFVKHANARGEIWAVGFRNPWKMSFDRRAGDLWVGDVGWELWELIHRVERGGNYGWSIMEGPQPIRADLPPAPSPISPAADALPHSIAASVTGGYVYRGHKFPELVGMYLYGDWETRRLWGAKVRTNRNPSDAALPSAAGPLEPRVELADPSVRLISFGETNTGELYLMDYDAGSIHELARNEQQAEPTPFPKKLSQTGLFAASPDHSLAQRAPAAGVIPFSIRAEQWSDHAQTDRWIALPHDSSVIDLGRPAPVPGSMFDKRLEFPKNAVLVKTLSLEMQSGVAASKRPIETQILHFDGRDWNGYSYAWDEAGQDAELVSSEGMERTVTVVDPLSPGGRRVHHWSFVGRAQCGQCHNQWARSTLAFNAEQLDREIQVGGGRLRQLELLRDLRTLVGPNGAARGGASAEGASDAKEASGAEGNKPKAGLSKPDFSLVDHKDPSASLEERARSYLHVNCAHCHRNGGGGSATIELKKEFNAADMRLLGAPPARGAFGLDNAALVTPGSPGRSILLYRMAKTGRGRMPHLGSEMVDDGAVKLIARWIDGLGPPQADPEFVEAVGQLARSESSNETTAVIEKLLSRTATALQLALHAHELPPAARERTIELASAHADPAIRDLFERFLPPERRAARLGSKFDLNALLGLPGNAERGGALFRSMAMQCANCHRVGETGGQVGPDLTHIASQRNRSQLLESLLAPSKTIEPKFAAQLVETTDGRVVTGILVSRGNNEVVLRDAANREVRLPANQVERIRQSPLSLMPDELLRDLTPQQAADLLEYLVSLR